MWWLDRLLGRVILQGSLTVIDHDGRTRRYGDASGRPVAIRFTAPDVAGGIARDPALGAGEAWMEGRLLMERGEIEDLVELVTANLRWDRDNATRVALWGRGRALARLAAVGEEWNHRTRARANVAHHYGLDGRLYEQFLGRERQYSCAYFAPGNDGADSDLDRAQADKLARIAAKLDLRPGQRVLDIGCGWGGLALHLARTFGVEVHGITLSREQQAFASRRAADEGLGTRARFTLTDWRDVAGPFDRIVSVGMFEHVGRPAYRAFFDRLAHLLAPSGVALVHAIGRLGGPGVTDGFTRKYIFPGGYAPALSEVTPHVERAFLWLADVEVWRLHYALTIAHWQQRCWAARDSIVALYDERFWRMWRWYLASARSAFLHDDHVVFQLLLTRRRATLPLTRGWMEAPYRSVPGRPTRPAHG